MVFDTIKRNGETDTVSNIQRRCLRFGLMLGDAHRSTRISDYYGLEYLHISWIQKRLFGVGVMWMNFGESMYSPYS